MYKNKSHDNLNNICGRRIKHIRLRLPEKTSHRKLADMLVLQGLDVDKNAIQRIEAGQRFVTDIELKMLARVLNTSYNDFTYKNRKLEVPVFPTEEQETVKAKTDIESIVQSLVGAIPDTNMSLEDLR